ncbi:hypothetical protein HanIR_Chr04g0174981 [Helianthus annuus]|nr:hypothetical protein HanIR_Chr04g0174981 [Helianthus annuus]
MCHVILSALAEKYIWYFQGKFGLCTNIFSFRLFRRVEFSAFLSLSILHSHHNTHMHIYTFIPIPTPGSNMNH